MRTVHCDARQREERCDVACSNRPGRISTRILVGSAASGTRATAKGKAQLLCRQKVDRVGHCHLIHILCAKVKQFDPLHHLATEFRRTQFVGEQLTGYDLT